MGKGKVVELHPTAEEIEHWREQIRSLYEIRLGKDNYDEVEEAVTGVIEKARKGWPNAPKSFASRVRNASKDWGVDGETRANLKGTPKDAIATKIKDSTLAKRERELDAFLELYEGFTKKLAKTDKNYFNSRVRYYMREYRFNMSSDLPLLLELIAEELLHRKIMMGVAKESNLAEVAKLSRTLKLVTDNMSNIQKTLGITRQQRQQILGGTEGSVAEVSMLLDDKKKRLSKIKKEEEDQERMLMDSKRRRKDLNQLPEDKTELQRILNRTKAIEVR